MKKSLAVIFIVLVLLLGTTFFYFKGKRYEIEINQNQIDSALADQYPATRKYLFIFSITYSNPKVILLKADNRVHVGLDAILNIRLNDEVQQLGGGATVTSGIRYENATQEFFLDKANFERLEIRGIPPKYLDQVTEFASKAAKEFIETSPVYKLEAKDAKTAAAKLLLKDFEVRDQVICVTLGI